MTTEQLVKISEKEQINRDKSKASGPQNNVPRITDDDIIALCK
jgi:hypothetical protein